MKGMRKTGRGWRRNAKEMNERMRLKRNRKSERRKRRRRLEEEEEEETDKK
jgi:hypothetical protein